MTLKPAEEAPVMMSPIEYLNQPIPTITPTPMIEEIPKKVPVAIVPPKANPGISKHSKDI